MTDEIERKFMVAALPRDIDLAAGRPIRQGYLAEEGEVEVRLRLSVGEARLTVKAGRGLARTEVDLDLDRENVAALWSHTAGRRIDKVRHRVALAEAEVGAGDLVADVDVYAGDLTGLCTVEVEFASVDDAARFVAPTWFGRELTGDAGWSNASLARHGRPD